MISPRTLTHCHHQSILVDQLNEGPDVLRSQVPVQEGHMACCPGLVDKALAEREVGHVLLGLDTVRVRGLKEKERD